MRKTNFSKSSLSACNARPVHTDGPTGDMSLKSLDRAVQSYKICVLFISEQLRRNVRCRGEHCSRPVSSQPTRNARRVLQVRSGGRGFRDAPSCYLHKDVRRSQSPSARPSGYGICRRFQDYPICARLCLQIQTTKWRASQRASRYPQYHGPSRHIARRSVSDFLIVLLR